MNQHQLTRRQYLRQTSMLLAGTTILPLAIMAQSDTKKETVHIKKDDGERIAFGGMQMQFKLNKQHTAGLLGCDMAQLMPGFMGAPPHWHDGFDEIVYVMDGTLQVWVDGQLTSVETGDWHLRPRGLPHSFWNSGSTPAHFINFYTPGGHEDYLHELGSLFRDGRHPSATDFALLERKHDIHYKWKMLQTLMDTYKVRL